MIQIYSIIYAERSKSRTKTNLLRESWTHSKNLNAIHSWSMSTYRSNIMSTSRTNMCRGNKHNRRLFTRSSSRSTYNTSRYRSKQKTRKQLLRNIKGRLLKR